MTTAARSRWARPLTVAIATAAAAALWAVLRLVFWVNLDVQQRGHIQPVGLITVVAAATASGLLGWLVVAFLASWASRPRSTWISIGVGVTVVSLTGPFTLATNGAAALCLSSMHVVVALTLIPGLARTLDLSGRPTEPEAPGESDRSSRGLGDDNQRRP